MAVWGHLGFGATGNRSIRPLSTKTLLALVPNTESIRPPIPHISSFEDSKVAEV